MRKVGYNKRNEEAEKEGKAERGRGEGRERRSWRRWRRSIMKGNEEEKKGKQVQEEDGK